jgi:hypothetical protein
MKSVGRSFRYAVIAVISMLGALPLCAQDNIVGTPWCKAGNGASVPVVVGGPGNAICTLAYQSLINGSSAYSIEMDGICTLGQAIGARADSQVLNCKNVYNMTVSATSSYTHVNTCGGHNLGKITATGYVSTLSGATVTQSSSWEDCNFGIKRGLPATVSGNC